MNAAILDSSVVGAWMIEDEPFHEAALRLMAAVGDGRIEPFLASHCQFEVRHALVRAARRGRVGWADLPLWFDAIDALEATIVPPAEKVGPVLALAERFQLSWSDAQWVEIAARLDIPLVTADLRLVRSVPDEVAILVDVRDAVA